MELKGLYMACNSALSATPIVIGALRLRLLKCKNRKARKGIHAKHAKAILKINK